METIDALKKYCTENGRICPQPQRWNELYQLLPNKKRVENGWEPSVPLILAAWWDTPHLSKMIRLVEHLEWAEKTGCLEQIGKFLRNLSEKEWYHGND